jgi:hypothetical protein
MITATFGIDSILDTLQHGALRPQTPSVKPSTTPRSIKPSPNYYNIYPRPPSSAITTTTATTATTTTTITTTTTATAAAANTHTPLRINSQMPDLTSQRQRQQQQQQQMRVKWQPPHQPFHQQIPSPPIKRQTSRPDPRLVANERKKFKSSNNDPFSVEVLLKKGKETVCKVALRSDNEKIPQLSRIK